MNGRNLLSVDFDRTTKTEKIYDDHRKFLLRIAYDTSGHPTLWLPSSKLMAVNVTYSSTGQIASVQRGTTSEKVDYDGQGRIVSRVFADGKTWSYTYLDKVCRRGASQRREGMIRSFQRSPRALQGRETGGMCRGSIYYSKYQYVIRIGAAVMNFCISQVVSP